MADYGFLTGLASGVQTGLKAYQDESDRQVRLKQLEDERKIKTAMGLLDIEKSGYQLKDPEKGIVSGNFVEKPEHIAEKRADRLAKYAGQGIMPDTTDEFGIPTGFKETPYKAEERAINREYKRGLINAVNAKTENATQDEMLVPGYQKVIKGKVDSKDLRDMRDAASDQKSLDSILGQIVEKGKGVTLSDQLNPASKTKNEIENLLRDAQLIYKSDAFAKLGVLTGPDLRILEQVIENPAGAMSSIKGKENVISRIEGVRQRIKQKLDNKLESRGFLPTREGLITPKTMTSEDQDALNWANNNPKDPRSAQIKAKLGVK